MIGCARFRDEQNRGERRPLCTARRTKTETETVLPVPGPRARSRGRWPRPTAPVRRCTAGTWGLGSPCTSSACPRC
eukprot:855767-Prorocentrum_minimum.AAC.9